MIEWNKMYTLLHPLTVKISVVKSKF